MIPTILSILCMTSQKRLPLFLSRMVHLPRSETSEIFSKIKKWEVTPNDDLPFAAYQQPGIKPPRPVHATGFGLFDNAWPVDTLLLVFSHRRLSVEFEPCRAAIAPANDGSLPSGAQTARSVPKVPLSGTFWLGLTGPARAGTASAANATQEIIIRFIFFSCSRVLFAGNAISDVHSNCFATGFRRCFKFSQIFGSTTQCVGGLQEHLGTSQRAYKRRQL